VAKRVRKALTKSERESLLCHINGLNGATLADAVNERMREVQLFSDKMQGFAEKLCESKQFLQEIAVHHRSRFAELYVECKKEADPFVKLQLKWHQYCSSFQLPGTHSLEAINLNQTDESSLVSLRNRWLQFCEANDVLVESNPVMITVSSAIYALLLERARDYQISLICSEPSRPASVTDGDDVYLRFGGAALCNMLHLHYKQIKSCPDTQRDQLSQEITILQAINTKDKSKIPDYLKYRDRGYMYFPDTSFIPFLRQIDDLVKKAVNEKQLEEDGRDIIKVCTIKCMWL